jgi:hypothetical protein
VLAPGAALITFTAGYQRINGNTLAGTKVCHFGAGFQYSGGKLMTQ